MSSRLRLLVVLLLLTIAAVVTASGDLDNSVSLDSAREVWSDVVRDADTVGLQVTRLSDAEEVALGNELARGLVAWAPEDPRDTAYVTAVAQPLLPSVRRHGIPYTFHVIESGEVNAFALPGGHVYVLRGMMDTMQSEAELACVLGHEIAHVDQRHAVERYQYRRALTRIGAGPVVALIDIAQVFLASGYAQYQEFEADEAGTRLAATAGYHPGAAIFVLSRLQQPQIPRSGPVTPAGEFGLAMDRAVSDYFRTHPDSGDRTRRLRSLAFSLGRRSYYTGVRNYALRVPRSSAEYAGEYNPAP